MRLQACVELTVLQHVPLASSEVLRFAITTYVKLVFRLYHIFLRVSMLKGIYFSLMNFITNACI